MTDIEIIAAGIPILIPILYRLIAGAHRGTRGRLLVLAGALVATYRYDAFGKGFS